MFFRRIVSTIFLKFGFDFGSVLGSKFVTILLFLVPEALLVEKTRCEKMPKKRWGGISKSAQEPIRASVELLEDQSFPEGGR